MQLKKKNVTKIRPRIVTKEYSPMCSIRSIFGVVPAVVYIYIVYSIYLWVISSITYPIRFYVTIKKAK